MYNNSKKKKQYSHVFKSQVRRIRIQMKIKYEKKKKKKKIK